VTAVAHKGVFPPPISFSCTFLSQVFFLSFFFKQEKMDLVGGYGSSDDEDQKQQQQQQQQVKSSSLTINAAPSTGFDVSIYFLLHSFCISLYKTKLSLLGIFIRCLVYSTYCNRINRQCTL
jgi:hypothetical protein